MDTKNEREPGLIQHTANKLRVEMATKIAAAIVASGTTWSAEGLAEKAVRVTDALIERLSR